MLFTLLDIQINAIKLYALVGIPGSVISHRSYVNTRGPNGVVDNLPVSPALIVRIREFDF